MSYEVSRHNTGVISSYEEFRCGLCSKVFSQCECTMAALSIHVGHTAGVSEERANRMDILGKAKNAKYATKTAARKAYYELHPERVAASNKAYRARVKAGLVGTVKTGRPTSRPSTGVVKTTQGGTPQKVVPDLEPTTGSGAVVKKTQVNYQMAHEWSMEPQGPKTRRRGNATRKDKKLAKELGL